MHSSGNSVDKTNYAQSMMHMIKGNLGTGILAMPVSFAHAGLVNAIIGIPILCIISTYCVHLLIKSSQKLGRNSKGSNLDYAELAKYSFRSGPNWMRNYSAAMCRLVDATLILTQIGVCSVYLVFVVDNLTTILASYQIHMSKSIAFACVYPVVLLLSYIRTLNRLAIASGFANFLQVIGICLVLEYLLRDINKINMAEREKFRPFKEVALGFGSAMFAFEGISVVLPIYSRMKRSEQMSGSFGVVNISYGILLVLYFVVGLLGFIKFGNNAKDSITLNLPPEPLYDGVRGIFAMSIFLTYPLQFYVPNEIIWLWFKKNMLHAGEPEEEVNYSNGSDIIKAAQVIEIPAIKMDEKSKISEIKIQATVNNCRLNNKDVINGLDKVRPQTCRNQDEHVKINRGTKPSRARKINLDRYDYLCRTALVTLTFVVAIIVPKLNLLMDLIGSISGTALSLLLPAIIHIATFWNHSKGFMKFLIITVDLAILVFGVTAGASGLVSSIASIAAMVGK